MLGSFMGYQFADPGIGHEVKKRDIFPKPIQVLCKKIRTGSIGKGLVLKFKRAERVRQRHLRKG
jgi:hypothetical protein